MVSALLGRRPFFRVCTLTVENFLFLMEPVPVHGACLTVPSAAVLCALCAVESPHRPHPRATPVATQLLVHPIPN